VTIADLARILQLVSSRPGARKRRRPGDVAGDFEEWFDGGAARAVDGGRLYQLGDGTRVTVAAGDRLAIRVEPPGGPTVVIEQR
jgi:hypothetical protein